MGEQIGEARERSAGDGVKQVRWVRDDDGSGCEIPR